REHVSARLEGTPKLDEVVDLAVQHDHDRPVLVRDRLVTVRNVDDREPPDAQRHLPVDVKPIRVRAPVNLCHAHALDGLAIGAAAPAYDLSGDPAHGVTLTCADRDQASSFVEVVVQWRPGCACSSSRTSG